ncbi:MAG: hypothetical protein ACRDSZ_13540 [Pseudonocardiaceae bacterium]
MIAADHRSSAAAAADDSASLPPVPEPGQVVNVRCSTWAVAEELFALTPTDAEAGMVQP